MCDGVRVSRRSLLAGMGAAAGSLALRRAAWGAMAEVAAKADDFVSAKPDKLVPFPMT